MRRRKFIAVLGAAAVSSIRPISASVQKRLPLIGVLHDKRTERFSELAAFRRGLADVGFVVGENVAIEYRVANLQLAKLAALAADPSSAG
jgi:putative ABC transport system substrate-binding protein